MKRSITAAIAVAIVVLLTPIRSAAAPTGSGEVTGFFSTSDFCDPCGGLGTNSFRWGIPDAGSFESRLFFIGFLFFNVEIGQPFMAGQFHYFNGNNLGRPPTFVNLVIDTHSPDPAFDQRQEFRINLVSTPNTADSKRSADYIYFNEYPTFGTLRMPENGSDGVADLKGVIHSFEFAGFVAVPDSEAFITATISPEDISPVSETGVSAVPEPASLILVGTGLAGLGVIRCRRRR